MRLVTNFNFTQHDETFGILKGDWNICGISVVNLEDVDYETGESILSLKIESLWLPDFGKKFYCYYSMSESKFKERCNDMDQNRGFKLIDVSCYLNQFSKLQIAAVWHSTEPKYKILKPELYKTKLQEMIYESLMLPF